MFTAQTLLLCVENWGAGKALQATKKPTGGVAPPLRLIGLKLAKLPLSVGLDRSVFRIHLSLLSPHAQQCLSMLRDRQTVAQAHTKGGLRHEEGEACAKHGEASAKPPLRLHRFQHYPCRVLKSPESQASVSWLKRRMLSVEKPGNETATNGGLSREEERMGPGLQEHETTLAN